VKCPTEKRRILIVDDEHIIADTTKAIFSNAGMEAMAVYSAEQAIALVLQWVPDAAIIDVQLPGMNGIDVAIHLKAKYPDCAVTLFSGHIATADLLEKTERDGYSFDVLAKPVHPADLLRRITLQLTGTGSA
jgi:CheY-like chemotaxis protein